MTSEEKEEDVVIKIEDDEIPPCQTEQEICSPDKSEESQRKNKQKPIAVKKNHPLYEIKILKYEAKMLRGVARDRTLTFTDIAVVLTPINVLNPLTENAVQAKNDYLVEETKFFDGDDFPLWDDAPRGGKAHAGELFAFCHNQTAQNRDLAEFFYVTGKLSKEHRPANWLVREHADRDVIVLSRYFGYTSVTDVFVALGSRPSLHEGKNCLRGTVRRILKKELTIWREH